jgi:iron complex outermembrane receptor protein
MILSLRFYILLIAANIMSIAAFAQSTTINGEVRNATTGEPVPAVSITVKGSGVGTYTNDKGEFTLLVNNPIPFTITVSSIGYQLQDVSVTSTSKIVSVSLIPESGSCNKNAFKNTGVPGYY